MLVEFRVPWEGQYSGWESSGLSYKPVVGQREHLFFCELVGDFAEYPTAPLRNLLTLGE